MKKLAVIILSFITVMPVFGADTYIRPSSILGFSVLDIPIGCKAIGMGDAFTAVADDSSAVSRNPAGLSAIRDIEIGLEYKKWFMDSSIMYLMGSLPLPVGTLGANVTYSSMGFFEQKDADGYLTGKVYNPFAVNAAVGYGLDIFSNLSAGASAGVVYQTVAEESYADFYFDIGAIGRPVDIFAMGISVQNLGAPADYPVPLNLKGGLALLALSTLDHRLVLSADVTYQPYFGRTFSAGGEYRLFNMVSLRGGYKFRFDKNNPDDPGGLRAGAGFETGIFKLDYSLMNYGDMGFNHGVTLWMVYGQELIESKTRTTGDYEKILIKKYFSDGVIFYNLGYYDDAREQFKRVLALEPDNKSAMAWIASVDKIISGTEKPAAVEDDGFLARAAMLFKNNDYSGAIEVLNAIPAVSANSEKAQTLINEINSKIREAEGKAADGEKLIQSGSLLAGVREVKKAQSMCPGCDKIGLIFDRYSASINKKGEDLYKTGIEKYLNGDVKEAITDWEKAVEILPTGDLASKVKVNLDRAHNLLRTLNKLKR